MTEKFHTAKLCTVIIIASLVLGVLSVGNAIAKKETFSPFFKVGTVEKPIEELSTEIQKVLVAAGFEVIGVYNPADDPKLKIIAYTRKDLQDITLKVKDRGMLAAILKVGLNGNDGKVEISAVNPEYLFRAYLMKEFAIHEKELKQIAQSAMDALGNIGSEFTTFGGDLTAKKLEHYHYKIGMEYFDNPVPLQQYDSFEEGVKIIRQNLAKKVNGAFEVFALIREDARVAVFGIGLGDEKTGETAFLPKIGHKHVAAMPYEIILMDKDATMLHGRFRIAIQWPTLSMFFGKYSFAGIMATPGDIKNTMKAVTQK